MAGEQRRSQRRIDRQKRQQEAEVDEPEIEFEDPAADGNLSLLSSTDSAIEITHEDEVVVEAMSVSDPVPEVIDLATTVTEGDEEGEEREVGLGKLFPRPLVLRTQCSHSGRGLYPSPPPTQLS